MLWKQQKWKQQKFREKPLRQWIPSLGDNLSMLLIPPAIFIKFFCQRKTAEQLESYMKQMCNGVGNVLEVATKNAYYREE